VTALLAPNERIRRVPLRITLVALLVALVAVALAATGVTATSMLRDYLTDQQDEELRATAMDIAGPASAGGFCGSRQYASPGDFLGCITVEGRPIVLAGPMKDGDRLPGLDRVVAAADADRGPARPGPGGDEPEPFTVPSSDGSTSWRMVAVELPNGSTALVGTDLAGDERAIGRLVAIEVFVGLIVLAVLGGTGYLLVRNSLRPLAEVERTARAIAAGDLSQRVPAGDDRTEVGRLSTALNGMLARIEQSFRSQQASEEEARASEERIRRFVADASHELRTPLTSIRGFAELYRQGAVRTEADVRRLMQRIEAEGGRMGLLVEDLLLLARLDQERPLTIAPVDLAEVAGDAVHDARAVHPDRPIVLHLDESLTDVPVVPGDDGRLRQVVGNLLTNALVHTPADARVTVTVAEDADDPGMLVLTVADEGPGMDSADAGRAFERFYRADASRTRSAGGTGLGLSIVASLVAAHGGSVALDTAPGRGVTVRVRLPRSGPVGTAPTGGAGEPSVAVRSGDTGRGPRRPVAAPAAEPD
jgi:two-component system OmpR family sensor kinase